MLGVARPREFDREDALRSALFVFWENDFESTTIRRLADAMQIGLPSLYAAFGDKRKLFDEVVQLYRSSPEYTVGYGLEQLPAREAVARMLRRAATIYTDPAHPRGCLLLSQPGLGRERETAQATLRELLADGRDLAPSDLDAATSFYAALLRGMSAQARDGASREELLEVAAVGMAAWSAIAGREP